MNLMLFILIVVIAFIIFKSFSKSKNKITSITPQNSSYKKLSYKDFSVNSKMRTFDSDRFENDETNDYDDFEEEEFIDDPDYNGNTIEVKIDISSLLNTHYHSNNSEITKRKQKYEWIKKGQEIVIDNYRIASGLFYTGEFMKSLSGYSIEPSFISNKLSNDTHNSELGYWPTFEELSNSQQKTYLNWLQTGRKNKLSEIGYVFIFFYGLERRIIHDIYKNKKGDLEEVKNILNELIRLLDLFGDNNSFTNYAANLIDFICFAFELYDEIEEEILRLENHRYYYDEYPLLFKFNLAKTISNNNFIQSDLALMWVKLSPFSYLRTPAIRCDSEFKFLFNKLFNEKFGDGYKIKPNKTKIKYSYRPASSSFSHDNLSIKSEIIDFTVQSQPLNKFKQIAEESTDLLDAYSRYLGRHPEDSNSINALSLLPIDIFNQNTSPSIQNVKEKYLGNIQDNNHIIVKAESLLKTINYNSENELKKKEVVAIIQFLGKLNIGVEPDIRFGSPQFKIHDEIILFAIKSDINLAPSKEYLAASLIATLGIFISAADGNISEEEVEVILNHIKTNLELSNSEIERLKYFIEWGKTIKLSTSKFTNKLKEIGHDDRSVVLSFLLSLANADGHISPEEITLLNKVYKIFEKDEKRLYSDIHQLQVGSDHLYTVITGDKSFTDNKIPQDKVKSFSLNRDLIRKTLHETEEVQGLLNTIFNTEDEIKQKSIIQNEVPTNNIFSLDFKHSELVRKLVEQECWTNDKFEEICESLNLMPEGALENINEAIFNEFEDDLIYAEENIEINQNIIKEVANVC